jgi:hypothetical protein
MKTVVTELDDKKGGAAWAVSGSRSPSLWLVVLSSLVSRSELVSDMRGEIASRACVGFNLRKKADAPK